MDQPNTTIPSILPLTQASAAQLAQAILTAREALSIYYPSLTIEQWQRAFEELGFPLRVIENRATPTALGLRNLIDYFEARYISPSTLDVPETDSAAGPKRIQFIAGQYTAQKAKKTYDIRGDVLSALERASFWRRVSKSHLVNRALIQLLADMPEIQVPVPPREL